MLGSSSDLSLARVHAVFGRASSTFLWQPNPFRTPSAFGELERMKQVIGQPGQSLLATNIDKWFRKGPRKTRVLQGFSVEAHPGQILALSGPSGAGKTTLLNILAGIDGPSRGGVRAAGRRHRGFIFQDYNLLESLTAERNARLSAQLQGKRIPRGEVARVFAELGLAGLQRRLPHELSGGQQQRVAIARVLLAKCAYIFADEPTGALDPENAEIVHRQLRQAADAGAVIVLVSHSAESLAIADRHVELQPAAAPGVAASGAAEPEGRR